MVSPLPITHAADLASADRAAMLDRSGGAADVVDAVEEIVHSVAAEGDAAVRAYTQRFDGVELGQLAVPQSARDAAGEALSAADRTAIERAADAIERFHERARPEPWFEPLDDGVWAGQLVRPLDAVGCYAPGGEARYPSSVLMTAIPARVADVDTVALCTPPRPDGSVDPATLYAAHLADVDAVYAVGGAQAVAAMAHGTETIPAVDAVAGPGNVYVTAAKRLVADRVEIDVLAGPSELLVVADESADATAVAWDLIAQSEHDPENASVLATTDDALATAVQATVDGALETFPRADVVAASFEANGHIVVFEELSAAIEFANEYAPEHLQLMVDEPRAALEDVRHAGTVFLGHATSTSLGDYAIGPSHVLPTARAARRRSGLSVASFVRTPSVQRVDETGLARLAPTAQTLADLEGLPGHARAVAVRLEGDR